MMDILELFPTSLGVSHRGYSSDWEIEKDYALKLADDGMVKVNGFGNGISVNTYILNEQPFYNLKLWIESQVDQYYNKTYSPRDDSSMYITQSWLNYAEYQQHHFNHYHRNCFIS